MAKLIKAEPLRRQLEMSRSTFDRVVAERRHSFPAPYYIGRHRFFDPLKVEAWMESLPKKRAQLAGASAKACTPDEPAYLIELAEVLETSDEATLGPTDARFVGIALRHYAAFLHANMP